MQNRSTRSWGIHVGVTACIALAGVIGTALPAQAAAGTRAATTIVVSAPESAPTSRPLVHGAGETVVPVRPNPADAAPSGDARSWASIIRAAVNALKKIPALWKKVVNGAKRTLAWFKTNVWASIKATVNLVSALLTAQEIWKYFN